MPNSLVRSVEICNNSLQFAGIRKFYGAPIERKLATHYTSRVEDFAQIDAEWRKKAGARLRDSRRDAGYTLESLNKLYPELSIARISKYERGERPLPPSVAMVLSKLFRCEVAWLLAVEHTNVDLTEEETEFLERYRQLDDDGKSAVKSMIRALNTSK